MQEISDKDFDRIKDLMYKLTGVLLRPTKKPLVVNRLHGRLEALGVKNFSDYITVLEKPGSSELELFINLITTNETYLFRHPEQFLYLKNTILPELEHKKQATAKSIKIWSAACSTGEEPCTLALVLQEYFKNKAGWNKKVLASDVNSTVLAKAKEGIFGERSFRETQPEIKTKYFSPIEINDRYKRIEFKLNQDVLKTIDFFNHNLMTPAKHGDVDVIFLRNVMIYFDSAAKQKTVDNLYKALRPGGYFIISLAESLSDIKTELNFLKIGIYKKADV